MAAARITRIRTTVSGPMSSTAMVVKKNHDPHNRASSPSNSQFPPVMEREVDGPLGEVTVLRMTNRIHERGARPTVAAQDVGSYDVTS